MADNHAATNITTQTKHLIHISDIHIGARSSRYQEYIDVFDKLAISLQAYKSSEIIIILTGNVLHSKSNIDAKNIKLINYLFDKLQIYTTIIIPGANDENIIQPFCIYWDNIYYLATTGIYKIRDLEFAHIAISTKMDEEAILDMLDQNIILLCANMRFAKNPPKCRLVLAGGVNDQQYGAPGALIQQSIGETSTKGFLVWDLANKTPQFIRIESTGKFIKLDLRGKSAQFVAESNNLTQNAIECSIIIDIDQIENINLAKLKPNTNIVVIPTNRAIAADYPKAMSEFLQTSHKQEIVEQFTKEVAQYKYTRWQILSMTWSNYFIYGPNNHIDFSNFGGKLSGCIAPNRTGKSCILDIIVLALFNKCLRGSVANCIRQGAKSANVIITLKCDNLPQESVSEWKHNSVYIISRKDTRTHCSIEISPHIGKESQESQTTTEKYRTLALMLGTSEHFLASSMYYSANYDICQMSPDNRLRILGELFSAVNYKQLQANLAKQIKDCDKKLEPELRGENAESIQKRILTLNDKLACIERQRLANNNQLEELTFIIKDTLPPEIISEKLKQISTAISNIQIPPVTANSPQNQPQYAEYAPKPPAEIAQLAQETPTGPIIDNPATFAFNNACIQCICNENLIKIARRNDARNRQIIAAKTAVARYNDFVAYTQRMQRIAAQNQLSKLQQEQEALNQQYAHSRDLGKSHELAAKLAEANRVLSIESARIAHELDRLASAKESISILTEREIAATYLQVLNSGKLQSMILAQNLARVEKLVNAKLSILANMSIKMSAGAIFIGDLPLEYASGFQKFAVSIALRFSLIELLPSTCENIFIDEGFGCLDKTNLENMNIFLKNLAPFCKSLFIISHNIELQNIIAHRVNIRCYRMDHTNTQTNTQTSTNTQTLTISFINSADDKENVVSLIEKIAESVQCVKCGKSMAKSSFAKHIKTCGD